MPGLMRGEQVSRQFYGSHAMSQLECFFPGIMYGLQQLKFCQHDDLQSHLLDTGDLPLRYTQFSTSPQFSAGKVLESLAAQLGTIPLVNGGYGNIGQPLPPGWTTLKHPDDVFWGLDTKKDRNGETSNQL